MSPKDIGTETLFLQHVADTLLEMPEDRSVAARAQFASARAANLLSSMGDELAASGLAEAADMFRATAATVAVLPEATGVAAAASTR